MHSSVGVTDLISKKEPLDLISVYCKQLGGKTVPYSNPIIFQMDLKQNIQYNLKNENVPFLAARKDL